MSFMDALNKKLGKMSFNAKKRNEFYEQLISLIRSGMSRRMAIETTWLIASKDGKKPKDVIALAMTDIKKRMANGYSFGAAMENWAPPDEVMVLNALENSSDFATSLENYMKLAKRRNAIKSSMIGGLIYPVFLLIAAYALVIFFGTSLMPQLSAIYPMEKWSGPASGLKYMTLFAQDYVVVSTITILVAVVLMVFSFPRWAKFGRNFADKLPFYNIYKAYSGVNFLVAMAALSGGGVKIPDALSQLIPKATPYVKHRLQLTRRHMLNGKNLGQALHDTKLDWPDQGINLNLKVFAQTQDLSESMQRLSDDSLTKTEKKINGFLSVMKNVMLLAVVGIIISLMVGIFSIQGQLASQTNF